MGELFQTEPVYTSMAIFGTSLFIIKTLLLFFSGDGDGSFDADAGEVDSSGHIDGSASFTLVSIQSVLSFFMGAGWAGLACRKEWGFESLESILISTLIGALFMLLSAFLSFKIKGLNVTPQFNMKDAVGTTGIAYTDIPKKGDGRGQVEISLNEKKQILQALSVDEKIKSFSQIKVIEVDDSGNLIVKQV